MKVDVKAIILLCYIQNLLIVAKVFALSLYCVTTHISGVQFAFVEATDSPCIMKYSITGRICRPYKSKLNSTNCG